MPASNRTPEGDIAEFNAIFIFLTDTEPKDAKIGEDGFLFIPLSANLVSKSAPHRQRISELAGPTGWRQHVVNDVHEGWWIKRPT